MALYVVGDVQGCDVQLAQLIERVERDDSHAHWFFVGDLVNRGPASLAALRRIRNMGERAGCVLGNHDLHLLAVAEGLRKPGRSDTLTALLQAPDRNELLDWLRHRPLAQRIDGHLMVHAGVLPQWSASQTLALAQEVESRLRGPDWHELLRGMMGNLPTAWDDNLAGIDRWRCILNALTRLRYCSADGHMVLQPSETDLQAPTPPLAWYDLPQRATSDVTVVFGHWAQRGLTLRTNLIGLDSGCVWGGKLSAVRLHDRAVFQVACPRFQAPE